MRCVIVPVALLALMSIGCVEDADSSGPAPTIREPLRHRPVAEGCDDVRPPGSGVSDRERDNTCNSDADCVDGRNGRCTASRFTQCSYDRCLTDAECTNDTGGGVCGCSGSSISDANVCLGGNCRIDADCASGFCSPSFGFCGEYDGVVAMYCHTEDDECLDDADCARQGAYCAFIPERERWACEDSFCQGK